MESLSLEDRLKRLIYLNVTQPQFYVGSPDTYQKDVSETKLTTIQEAIQNDFKELFPILDAANKDPNLPRRSILFLFLARLMHFKEVSPDQKSRITAKVLELTQSDEDIFNFIKYYTELRENSKMPTSVIKLVRRFYSNKSPLELAQSVAKHNKMLSWSHKDLIKLVHFKSDTPLKNIVVNYILTRQIKDNASAEELKILNIIKKSDELRKTKGSVDAIPLLTTEKLTMEQVSPSLHQNAEVWNAAIPNMTIQQILPCLGKLYKLGLLKANSDISKHLIELFTSPEKVKQSGVHPIEVFSYMKRLEKGGKPVDLKLLNHLRHEKKMSEPDLKKVTTRTEAKCLHILSALLKCFDLACSNVTPTNKRFLVTIDVTAEAKKAVCIGNKVLSLLEAAVAYAVVLLRVEKDVVLATYNGDKIELLSFEKKIVFTDMLTKVQSRTSTYYSSPFASVDWAASEKRHVDVFINFIHNDYSAKMPKEKSIMKNKCEPVVKYRSKVNLPNAKTITFAPVKKNMVIWADTPPNVLDILGFDTVACKVAECFSRGTFS